MPIRVQTKSEVLRFLDLTENFNKWHDSIKTLRNNRFYWEPEYKRQFHRLMVLKNPIIPLEERFY